jgi:hypothetical protein
MMSIPILIDDLRSGQELNRVAIQSLSHSMGSSYRNYLTVSQGDRPRALGQIQFDNNSILSK